MEESSVKKEARGKGDVGDVLEGVIMERKRESDASVAPRMEIVTPKEFYDFLFTF